jgi:predicted DNA-binding mobile mystery protein A
MSKLYNVTQLDKKLSSNSEATYHPAPHCGWIKAIRTTIGMTYKQLAYRVGVSSRRISAIEEAESKQKLKLETLAKVADALGCELRYVLTPKQGNSLLSQIEKRAQNKARKIITSSSQHMSLEDQLANTELNNQVKLLAQELMHENLKRLWDE